MSSTESPPGVKDDLKTTITRKFRGVASFLAPPYDPTHVDDVAEPHPSVRADLAEIKDKVVTQVSGLASIASRFLQLGADEDEREYEEAVGVTKAAVAFARDISVHQETWLNFPPFDDKDDDEEDEFELSDAQQEHALAVERLAPELADLRFALCPSYMSESSFWKIYFVLLHPKLDKNDAVVLSTPQILKARAFLTAELRNRPKPRANQESSEKSTNVNELSFPLEATSEPTPLKNPTTIPFTSTIDTDIEIEKHPIQSTQVPVVDKSVVDQGTLSPVKDQNPNPVSSTKVLVEKYDDDGDDWLNEEGAELASAVKSTVHIEDDEDVSFSDLEED